MCDAMPPLGLDCACLQLQFGREATVSALGTAVVVDGAALLLTPLRHTVVPPPLCAAAAALPAPVTCLALRSFGECEVGAEDSQLASTCGPVLAGEPFPARSQQPGGTERHLLPSHRLFPHLLPAQAVAAVLSDGRIALLESVEADLWEESLEEQLEAAPWDRWLACLPPCLSPCTAGSCCHCGCGSIQAVLPERTSSSCCACPPAFHCRPGQPKLLPRLLAVESPALEAAAATGSGTVQAAAWVDDTRLLLVVSIGSSDSELLVELAVDATAGSAAEVAALSRGVLPLICCCSRPDGGVLLQQHSGALLLYSAGGLLQPLPAAASFPGGCQQMAALPTAAVVPWGAAADPAAAVVAFGLNARGQLYWGARQLAADVTSFAVSPLLLACPCRSCRCGSGSPFTAAICVY